MKAPFEPQRGRWSTEQLGSVAMWLEFAMYAAVLALLVGGLFYGR